MAGLENQPVAGSEWSENQPVACLENQPVAVDLSIFYSIYCRRLTLYSFSNWPKQHDRAHRFYKIYQMA